MHNFANTVLWIYIVLLLVGGLIGFFKANSKVSLISSSVFAAVLVLTQTGNFEPSVSLILVNVLLAALLVVFAIRLAEDEKIHAERIDAGADHPDAGAAEHFQGLNRRTG